MLYKLRRILAYWVLTFFLTISFLVVIPSYVVFTQLTDERHIATWLERSNTDTAVKSQLKTQFTDLLPEDSKLRANLNDYIDNRLEIDNQKVAHIAVMWLTGQEPADTSEENAGDTDSDSSGKTGLQIPSSPEEASTLLKDYLSKSAESYLEKQLNKTLFDTGVIPTLGLDRLQDIPRLIHSLQLILRIGLASSIGLLILLFFASRNIRSFILALGLSQAISGIVLLALPYYSIGGSPFVQNLHIWGVSVRTLLDLPAEGIRFLHVVAADLASTIHHYAIGITILGGILVVLGSLKLQRVEVEIGEEEDDDEEASESGVVVHTVPRQT